MRLDTPARRLGAVPVEGLVRWLAEQSESAWSEDAYRQEAFRVHRHTRSLRAVWTEPRHFPTASTDISALWGAIEADMRPVFEGVRAGLGHSFSVANVMFARLDPGGHIPMHSDVGAFFAACHRVHVPLSTEPEVMFVVDGERIVMQVGEAWEIDNTRMHGVSHAGRHPRVHLIMDLSPAASA